MPRRTNLLKLVSPDPSPSPNLTAVAPPSSAPVPANATKLACPSFHLRFLAAVFVDPPAGVILALSAAQLPPGWALTLGFAAGGGAAAGAFLAFGAGGSLEEDAIGAGVGVGAGMTSEDVAVRGRWWLRTGREGGEEARPKDFERVGSSISNVDQQTRVHSRLALVATRKSWDIIGVSKGGYTIARCEGATGCKKTRDGSTRNTKRVWRDGWHPRIKKES